MTNVFEGLLSLFDDESKRAAAKKMLGQMNMEPRGPEGEGRGYGPSGRGPYHKEGSVKTTSKEFLKSGPHTVVGHPGSPSGEHIESRQRAPEGDPFSAQIYELENRPEFDERGLRGGPQTTEDIRIKYEKEGRKESDPDYLRSEITRLRGLLKELSRR